MTEESDTSTTIARLHSRNIEILKEWNIGDKVRITGNGKEALGIVKGFKLTNDWKTFYSAVVEKKESCAVINLIVYNIYEGDDVLLLSTDCEKITA